MIQIGRVGGDITFEGGPATASWQGDRLTLTGNIRASSEANQKALRQQLLGHVDNPDEPVIPIVWPYDTDVTGFYRPLGASADLYQSPKTVVAFSLDLERVPGYQAPLFELWSRGTLRVNAHSITTTNATPWIALPEGSTGLRPSDTDLRVRVVAGENGDSIYIDGGVSTEQQWFYDASSSFYLPPGDHYNAAATIELDGNVVVGEQIINDPSGLVITNGHLRLSGFDGSNFDVEVYDGSTWQEAATSWRAMPEDDVNPPNAQTWTVLRNSPDAVSVRVSHDWSLAVAVASGTSMVVDYTLRRGGRYVEGFITTTTAGGLGVGNDDAAGATGTGITGGLMRDGADANGNTWVMASPVAHTEFTTAGNPKIVASSAVDEFPFMIGVSTGTDGILPNPDPATIDVFSPQGLVYQYMAAVGTRQNIAVR